MGRSNMKPLLHIIKNLILTIVLCITASAWCAAEKKNVLITGGAGYIGSQTCKALYQAGYQPIAYDNLSRGHKELVKWGPLEIGDISDRQMLKEVIAKYNPVAVIHFAALKAVGESVADPAKYYFNNVYGTLVLLDTLREMGDQECDLFQHRSCLWNPRNTCCHRRERRPTDQPLRPYQSDGRTDLKRF